MLSFRNFNTILEASVTIKDSANIQYLRALVRGEVLRQFDGFSDEVENTSPETLSSIILGLGAYFFPVNDLSKQRHAMRRGIRKPRGLKVRRSAACLIELNDYLNLFPVAKKSDKTCLTELNEILLNSIPRIWRNQAYVQGLDCESIT